MAKLYVFGIGGTGARVIKSLTLMLAAGVKLDNKIDTVVPVIIDPDSSNGDLTRTTELLENYFLINEKIGSKSGFFGTSIKTLTDLSNDAIGNVQNKFKMLDTGATQNGRFSEFLGYGSMPQASKSLIELLFSEENLKADMTVGFKGNPNIGSVVLNQFKESIEYKIFLNSFASGDSIFIISSIFGGTGSAGFPLLLRNLREEDSDLTNSDLVANSKIGALSMMPYFKVQEPKNGEKKTIDSGSFSGKAKAALDFYSQSIFKHNELNSFYSIGEDSTNFYEHNDGQSGQKNKAHFIELAAALAIVDFSFELQKLKTENSRANDTHYKEFGIEDLNSRQFNFSSLGRNTKSTIQNELSQFILMSKLNQLVTNEKFDLTSPWYDDLKKEYSNSGFHTLYLEKVEKQFVAWINEMENNDISFKPFNMDVSYDKFLTIIDGYYGFKSGMIIKTKKLDAKELESELNTAIKKETASDNSGKYFIDIFYKATQQIVTNILST